jgi:hypothetical protein
MVRANPTLASRYAKHFGTTNYGVADYFGKRVSLIRLRKATTTYVYYYNSHGQVSRGRRVMPAGTLVFATESGEPVLDWRCGNPLRSSLPIREAIKPGNKSPKMAKSRGGGGGGAAGPDAMIKMAAAPPDADKIVDKVLSLPPAELPAATAATPAMLVAADAPLATTPALAAVGVAAPPIVELAAVPAVGAVGAVPVIAGGSSGLGWLAPLFALGGAARLAGNSRHGSASITTITPPASVPEPGTLLPLAACMATACTAMMKKRKTFLR